MQRLLTAGEVAKILDLSTERVRQLVDEGKLRAEQRQPLHLFKATEVERLRLARENGGSK